MNENITIFPIWIQWTHFGLAVFGITAYLTGELAEHSSSYGYLLHAYLGMSLLLFLMSRFIYGILGQHVYRFSNWFPYKFSYFATIKEDLKALAMLKLPSRIDHRGLSGLVQWFGLMIFSWMAITGTIMFIIDANDDSLLTELHEVGEGLIPLFLGLHLSAVALHMISGHNILSKIFPMKKKKE